MSASAREWRVRGPPHLKWVPPHIALCIAGLVNHSIIGPAFHESSSVSLLAAWRDEVMTNSTQPPADTYVMQPPPPDLLSRG